ncbi:MAG: DUF1295 domain-containing protein [Myxococcales bacterium]|nr:DUF1295 domain-containing protein [Myxococcales bacterium]MCB9703041.1 DUF1295 domain-containing protein [Myxococcales bacterium]
MSPLEVIASIAAVAALLCWLLAELSGEHSWVDRLWSILPVIYVGWLAVAGGPGDPRLLTMAILVALWGGRLTFNFARKGGYRPGGEDYRWAELRARMSPGQFRAFNLLFIAGLQNLLLFLLALPAYYALAGRSTPWGIVDTIAALLFLVSLAGETVADEEQWRFHQAKRARAERGEEGPRFLTTGLFGHVRHPNFLCEMAIWWSFYLFSVGAGAGWLNPAIVGPLLLTALFQGSTAFTEELSLRKYPEYAEYQRSTPRLLPRPRRRAERP